MSSSYHALSITYCTSSVKISLQRRRAGRKYPRMTLAHALSATERGNDERGPPSVFVELHCSLLSAQLVSARMCALVKTDILVNRERFAEICAHVSQFESSGGHHPLALVAASLHEVGKSGQCQSIAASHFAVRRLSIGGAEYFRGRKGQGLWLCALRQEHTRLSPSWSRWTAPTATLCYFYPCEGDEWDAKNRGHPGIGRGGLQPPRGRDRVLARLRELRSDMIDPIIGVHGTMLGKTDYRGDPRGSSRSKHEPIDDSRRYLALHERLPQNKQRRRSLSPPTRSQQRTRNRHSGLPWAENRGACAP